MKNTFKYLVNCFLFVFLFFSLFLFPVSAEEDIPDLNPLSVSSEENLNPLSEYTLTDFEIRSQIFNKQNYPAGSISGTKLYEDSSTLSYFNLLSALDFDFTPGNAYQIHYSLSDLSIVNGPGLSGWAVNELSYITNKINFMVDGDLKTASCSGGSCTVNLGQAPYGIIYPVIDYSNANWRFYCNGSSNNILTVNAYITFSTFGITEIDLSSINLDVNKPLDNPIVFGLVNQMFNDGETDFSIYYQTFRTDNACVNSSVTSGACVVGYASAFSVYLNGNFTNTIYLNYSAGTSCTGSESSYSCRLIYPTFKTSQTLILDSSHILNYESPEIIVNDSKGNALLESGNSSSQSASSSLNNTTSDFNNTASELESFESQFNSGMTSALANIDISGGNLGNVSDFVSTANFVKLQFDSILDNSGIYKSVITFSLILGLALLLIGRRS